MKKVLVVDDRSGIRFLLCELLEQKGYEVYCAATGKEALDSFIRIQPDFIFLDMKLPDISGIDVLKQIRINNNFSTVHVVTMTAYRELNMRERALQLGACCHLHKPFDINDVLEILLNVCTLGNCHAPSC